MDYGNAVPAHTRTISDLLHQGHYSINYYQRQYAWKDTHVSDLMKDLIGEFRRYYQPQHIRTDVATYGMYFLGPITLMKEGPHYEIIDGQQRITSLLLLIIALHHRITQDNSTSTPDLKSRIYTESFGQLEFVLNAPDRHDCFERLLTDGIYNPPTITASNARILRAYNLMAAELDFLSSNESLCFSDWLLERTYVLTISTDPGRDAHTIYLTMNDRGQRLTDDDKLKAYLLSELPRTANRHEYSAKWQRYMDELDSLDGDHDLTYYTERRMALTTWLRAQYAGANAGPQSDHAQIYTQMYRWIRDNAQQLQLTSPGAVEQFVNAELFTFLDLYIELKRAAATLTPQLEAVRYFSKAYSSWTHNVIFPPLLAPIKSSDPIAIARKKIQIVATYLDILTSRRIWSRERNNVDDLRVLKPIAAQLADTIRDTTIDELVHKLHALLDEGHEFAIESGPRYSGYNADTRWVLARLTESVQMSVDGTSIFDDFDGAKYQIEHLWSENEDVTKRGYSSSREFRYERQRIGCLILLRSSVNQSLQDMPYEEKVSRYARENVLAQSLYEDSYLNNPSLRKFREESGLPLRAHKQFNREDLQKRQGLYADLAEHVWNPRRLDEEALR